METWKLLYNFAFIFWLCYNTDNKYTGGMIMDKGKYMKQKYQINKAIVLSEVLTCIINGYFLINAFVLGKSFTEIKAIILLSCNIIIQTVIVVFNSKYKRCRKPYYVNLCMVLYSVLSTVMFKADTDYLFVVLFIAVNSFNFYYQLSIDA